MENHNIRDAILRSLYRGYKKDGFTGRRFFHELAAELGVGMKSIEAVCHYLQERGFVDTQANAVATIEAKGVDYVEGPSPFNAPGNYAQQVIEIKGGNVGQITQAHIIHNPSDLLNQLADLLDTAPGLQPEKKKEWKGSLLEMSRHPALIEVWKRLLSILPS